MTPRSEAPADTAAATAPHACRPGCAACCIAPSISSPVPAACVPAFDPASPGSRATVTPAPSTRHATPVRAAAPKPAGVPCSQLSADLRCRLFGSPLRPAVCASLRPEPEMCGDSREHAMRWLTRLEHDTRPGGCATA